MGYLTIYFSSDLQSVLGYDTVWISDISDNSPILIKSLSVFRILDKPFKCSHVKRRSASVWVFDQLFQCSHVRYTCVWLFDLACQCSHVSSMSAWKRAGQWVL